MGRRKFFAVWLFILFMSFAGNSRAGIFVLDRSTGTVTEFSPVDFNKIASHQIPADLFFSKARSESGQRSNGLLVSASGRILYFMDVSAPDNRTIERKLWYFSGSKEYRADVSIDARCAPSVDRCMASDVLSAPALDAKEDAFYWWVNRVADYKDIGPGRVRTDFELYRAGFGADGRLAVARAAGFSFGECECATGACEETCPSGEVEPEKAGITDFIDVEHIVHGQVDTTVEGHTYFSKKDGGWSRTEVNPGLKKPFLRTEYDGGCCGWVNEGSDRLILADGAKESVIYDEWGRFDNKDYDISFFPASAKLSPDLKKVAYTITTDPISLNQFRKDGTIRLSSDGKANPRELKRIGELIEVLPFVEIAPIDNMAATVTIEKAEFAGWIGSSRILVLKDGKLAVYDVTGRRRTGPAIGASSVDDVFVR